MTWAMTLHLRELAVGRGGRRLLSGLNCDLLPGQATILRGPNGIGKSTLLRTLAGFSPPVSGNAELGEIKLTSPEDWQDQIAYAGHLDAVKPQLSVRQNLAFWAALYGVGQVDAAVAGFDLAGFLDRDVHACSAGQRRRLGLSRLLLVARPLWLLDEPSVSLDAASRQALAKVMQMHLNRGGLILMATHDDDLISGAGTMELGQYIAPKGNDAFLEGAFV